MAYGILLYMWRTVGTALYPKRSKVLLWGILPQILIVIPNFETLHSTIEVLRTLWAWNITVYVFILHGVYGMLM